MKVSDVLGNLKLKVLSGLMRLNDLGAAASNEERIDALKVYYRDALQQLYFDISRIGGEEVLQALQTVQSGETEVEEDAVPPLVAGLTTEWSRPRGLKKVFELLWLEVPGKLTEGKWAELLRELRRQGVQIADYDCNMLASGWRPSINDKVRLKLGPRAKADAKSEPDLAAPVPAVPVDSTVPPPPVRNRNQVFLSYSHKDKKWLDRLLEHLKPLERNGVLVPWVDTQIAAGTNWRDEISAALSAARVAVLLVSSSFLNSDFIHNFELLPLVKAAERDGLKLIWVAVSSCNYQATLLEPLQAANDPNKPLDMRNHAYVNKDLAEISRQIARALSES